VTGYDLTRRGKPLVPRVDSVDALCGGTIGVCLLVLPPPCRFVLGIVMVVRAGLAQVARIIMMAADGVSKHRDRDAGRGEPADGNRLAGPVSARGGIGGCPMSRVRVGRAPWATADDILNRAKRQKTSTMATSRLFAVEHSNHGTIATHTARSTERT
jgi:hypothetical protein